MGSIFGHRVDLDLCSAHFAERHGKDIKRETPMVGDRAPFPRCHAQRAKRKDSAWDA